MDAGPAAPPDSREVVDARLISQLAAGDRKAMERLWIRWGRSFYAVAMKALPSQEDAEEVVQDLLVKIWQKAWSYDPALSQAYTWALMLLRGLIIDRLRYLDRRPKFLSLDPAAPELASPVHLSAEAREGLSRALAELSPAERDLLEAALFGSDTQEKIAHGLGEPVGTVKSRIRQAMQKFRNLLTFHTT